MSARTQYLIEQIEELRNSLKETKFDDDPEKCHQLQDQIKSYSNELMEAEKKSGNVLLG